MANTKVSQRNNLILVFSPLESRLCADSDPETCLAQNIVCILSSNILFIALNEVFLILLTYISKQVGYKCLEEKQYHNVVKPFQYMTVHYNIFLDFDSNLLLNYEFSFTNCKYALHRL